MRFLPASFLLPALLLLGGIRPARAFEPKDADTLFDAYNRAFYATQAGGAHYRPDTSPAAAEYGNTGFWTQAEEIEMAADVWDRTHGDDARGRLNALCNGFIAKYGRLWTANLFNDDLEWACLAMCRTFLATGNTACRDCARINFDAVWARGWTPELGGGILWEMTPGKPRTKNACSNGPAILTACCLHRITGEAAYLDKAKQIYAWERAHLFDAATGAVADGQSVATGKVNTAWVFTYNQGTFIGGANALHQATRERPYLDDALLATRHTRDALCRNGLFPPAADGGGDGATFNGIGLRWIARFVADQKLWSEFYPWLRANADAAWAVRRAPDNLSWCNWSAPTASGVRHANGCAGSVVALQVVPPVNPASER